MTIVSNKQGFLAVSAIAAIAVVAISIPNTVSASNLITYDFEFKFADNSSGIGYITVNRYNSAYQVLYRDEWHGFGFTYLGKTFTTSNVSYGSTFYPGFISFKAYDFETNNITQFIGRGSSAYVYDYRRYDLPTRYFSMKAVPVPAFALGIVAAGGWIALKQLRCKTKAVKQEAHV